MQKRSLGYYRTIVLLLIGFSLVGYYTFSAAIDPLIEMKRQSHGVYDFYRPMGNREDLDLQQHQINVTLEADHTYTIYIKHSGISREFISFSIFSEGLELKTGELNGINTNFNNIFTADKYLSPIEVSTGQQFEIVITQSEEYSDESGWTVFIYQDLPGYLAGEFLLIPFVIVLDVFLLLFWAYVYEQYQKPFKTSHNAELGEEDESVGQILEESKENLILLPDS